MYITLNQVVGNNTNLSRQHEETREEEGFRVLGVGAVRQFARGCRGILALVRSSWIILDYLGILACVRLSWIILEY